MQAKTLEVVSKQYGLLKFIRFDGVNSRNKTICLCECQCSKKTLVRREIAELKRNNRGIKSCGCVAKYGYVGELSKKKWGGIVSRAKRRDKDFCITQQYAWELFLKQNRKCALTDLPLCFPEKTNDSGLKANASLDRIDSSKGYIEGNVQWVHKIVNRMKFDLPEDVFKEFCSHIHRKAESDNKVYEWGLTSAIF